MGASASIENATYDKTKFEESKAIMGMECDDQEKFLKLKQIWDSTAGAVSEEGSAEVAVAAEGEATVDPTEPQAASAEVSVEAAVEAPAAESTTTCASEEAAAVDPPAAQVPVA